MRPLFAIAPLALAFALFGPPSSEAQVFPKAEFFAKVWHMVFDHTANPANETAQ